MTRMRRIQLITARVRSCIVGGCALWGLLFSATATVASLGDGVNHIETLCGQRLWDSAASALAALPQTSAAISDTVLLPLMYDIGDRFLNEGRLPEARRIFSAAVAIVKAAAADDTTDAVYGAATQAFAQGQYVRAEIFARCALNEWKTTNDDRQTRGMVGLGNIVLALHRRDEAELLYREALDYGRSHFGDDDYRLASAQWGLANLFLNDRRPAEAEPLYRAALPALTGHFGDTHRSIAGIRLNLGMVYKMLHQYDRALDECRAAYGIFNAVDPPRLGGMSNALSTMANIAREQNDFGRAEEYLQRALALQEEGYGSASPWTNRTRAELADFYLDFNKPDKAEPYQLEVLHIADSLNGPGHPSTAEEIIRLGRIRLAAGKSHAADSLFTRALDLRKRAFGDESLEVSECLAWQGRCARRDGDAERAAKLASRALAIREVFTRDFTFGGAERDALLFAATARANRNLYLSAVIDRGQGAWSTESDVANVIVRGKGDISDAVFQRRRMLAQPMDSDTEDLWLAYQLAQEELSDMFVQGPGDDDVDAFRRAIDSMTMVVNEREVRLARRTESFREARQQTTISYRDLCDRLPENACLIEYLKYAYDDPYGVDASVPGYIGLVLDHGGIRQLLDLGPAAPIEQMVSEYRNHFTAVAKRGMIPGRSDMREYSAIADSLYRFLWAPFEDSIAGKGLVLIAPDGELNRVSFATLKREDGPFLIESWEIHYLSAGRDLIRLHDTEPTGTGLLVIGNPDFAAAGVTGPALSQARTVANQDLNMTNALPRGFRTRCHDLGDFELKPLPSANAEIEEVTSIWDGEVSHELRVLAGADATESAFKSLAPGKLAIHVATHGYYLQNKCTDDSSQSHPRATASDDDIQNPLLQSGLFLAGCAAPEELRDEDATDDGVLTASEIASMGLSGTELVVLSACETGMGAVRSGEGVYGLRRAFQLAGVRTVVSTLWSIADEFTAPMLPTLYRQANGPLPTRLRKTQLDWITWLRDRGFADHPYTWGAFIAEGSWR